MPAPGPKRKARTERFVGSGFAGLWALALALTPAPAFAADPPPPSPEYARGCLPACERTVKDRALRARVCNRCLFHGDARGGWVKDLAKQAPFPRALLQSALSDPDWQVVREAATALSRRGGGSVAAVLGRHLKAAAPEARDAACLTVARVGADRKLSWRTWHRNLSLSPSLAQTCQARVKEALELELYGLAPTAATEAMVHLGTLFKKSPAEAVLDAMATRPKEADAAPAKVLLAHAGHGGPPVGLALLRAATEENRERVNRLVAWYMEQLEAFMTAPRSTEPTARRAQVAELGGYAPLSAPELEGYLWDADLAVRLAAARALAAGEGRTLAVAVHARVLGALAPKVPVAAQTRWVELLGAAGGRDCRKGPLWDIAHQEAAPAPVRTAAVVGFAGCAGTRAKPLVQEALRSPEPSVRAGGVLAQVELGPLPQTREVVAKALLDPAPAVREAGCTAAGLRRFGDLAEAVAQQLDAEETSLRRAAVEALGLMQARAHAGAVARRLGGDGDREVRLAAVGALAKMGGAQAAAALSEARGKDPESRVRREAEGALRRMGFAP